MSTKKVVKGKRYTPEEKQEVVSFIEKHNSENGRGGQTVAADKFGISQLTVSTWLKNAGSAPKIPRKRGPKPGSKRGPNKTTSKSGKSSGGYGAKLDVLTALGHEIDRAENALDKLKAKFTSLKGSL